MNELAVEGKRISRELHYVLQQGSVADESPLRLHSRDVDAGGAPEFHPAFLKYIDSGVCTCGRAAVCAPNCHFLKDRVLGHLRECEPACRPDTRFHRSTHKNHPSRLKRALRQVRRLNPHAYDLCYMIVALHMTFEQAVARLNEDEVARGRENRPDAEYAVLWVSGASLLASAY
jgi:hypothetical protein